VGLAAEEVLGFANHLFDQQEFFRAIGEFQRFLFLYPDNPAAPTAALRIAQCYSGGRRWEQALAAVDAFLLDHAESSLRWEAYFLRAHVYSGLGQDEEAREEYRRIIKAQPPQPLIAEAWYLIGLSYAKEGRLLEAEEALRQIGRKNTIYGSAQEVRHILEEASEANRKNPDLAGFLAAILPGAGHLYCDRPGDAALAFLFTGAFAWATVEAFQQDNDGLGIGLALVALAFYGGNIFSAVNVAHKYNDREERRFMERLAPYEQVSFSQPRAPSVRLALKFFF
jgi:tetratricopeptide (TPR) repeat protein